MYSGKVVPGWNLSAILLLALLLLAGVMPQAAAAEPVKLVINGQEVAASPPPLLKEGRTLVPVRLVSETMGAVVHWEAASRTVVITKDSRTVTLRIDNRLVDYGDEGESYGLVDVPPQIFRSRTFVPLRLVANALGVSVSWDAALRTVYVDAGTAADIMPFFNMKVNSAAAGQRITGSTVLEVGANGDAPDKAAELRYLLLDPKTGKGPVVARGNNVSGTYRWLPDPFYNGARILAAAVFDQEGHFLAGAVVPVELAVTPEVSLAGVSQEQVFTGTVPLKAKLNFVAEYVRYEITNQQTGKSILTQESDPGGSYDWSPQPADNGLYVVRAAAYDRLGQAYYSEPVKIQVAVERELSLRGVASGSRIEKPVTLWLSRNFPLSGVEYLLRDARTGQETLLYKTEGYKSYSWFPAPEQAGQWELSARVTDEAGRSITTAAVPVQVTGDARLLLKGVGPNQVITQTVNLSVSANVPMDGPEYYLVNPTTGSKQLLGSGVTYSWTPGRQEGGNWAVQAVASVSGGKLVSEAVPVRVYLGEVYTSRPVIEKSKFLNFAARLAEQSQSKTGMSAALQTAQAILETGWGQYTPVDKYSGQMSNNLFGIKGKGSAGSVISTTWEEYNGTRFNVDAAFRAYGNPAESWTDHKRLLLNGERYEPFRSVMHDSTQGAWALKRAGYATDSKYPMKLIDIIKRYDLYRLDEVAL